MENTGNFFALNLRRIRKSLDMTQTELADAVGVSMLTIQRYESGDRHPRPNIVKAIADVLKTTESELFANPDLDKKNGLKDLSADQLKDFIVKNSVEAFKAMEAEKKQTVTKFNTKEEELIAEITSLLPSLKRDNLEFLVDLIRRKVSVPNKVKKPINL